MKDHRLSSHTVSSLTAHIVWVTKYRHPVLQGDVQKRCREPLIQICDSEYVRILLSFKLTELRADLRSFSKWDYQLILL